MKTKTEEIIFFSQNIKNIIEYTKTSPYYLEKMIKIPHPTIYRYMKGENEPTITQAFKLANYFDLTLEELLLETDIIHCFEIKIMNKYKYNNKNDIISLKERFPNFETTQLLKK